ncbi:MAG: sensor histidine kinase [Candidatus Krumholzibacteriia bacterium]
MNRAAPGRARWLLGGLAAYLAILVAVAAGFAWLQRAARARLDDALGDRLTAVAATAAFLVDGDSLRAWAADAEESLEELWLRSRLVQVRRDNDLAEIALCTPDGRVLISAAERLDRGADNVFWDLDRAAVRVAQGGFPAASRLYRTAGIYQKSAHAPVRDAMGGIAGILTVEGAADYFGALAALRRGALAAEVAVMLFLAAMGVQLWRLQAGMARARAAAWRAEELAAMGRMTAAIAHEIRNPLGIIRGAAQHLAARLGEAGITDELAGLIPGEVDRLDRILSGYLTFGKGADAAPEAVDLERLARRTAHLVEAELARTGVRLTCDLAPGLPPAWGDPHRLQQALLNLLLNARDAMPEGGLVTLRLARDGEALSLTVLDEGRGLAGAAAEPLFAPFRTTKEKGSGLGLAIARQVAGAHGGTVTLRDRDDRGGAVAELRLPAARGAAD